MNNFNFIDYYRVLEVHYDARPEIIQAAYKRLSRIYHPDSGRVTDSGKMSLINDAYHILSDTSRRSAYHREWMQHFSARSQFVTPCSLTPPGQGDSSLKAAGTVMEMFFQAQKIGEHEEAYLLLTKEDQERTTAQDFLTWRTLVKRCYELQDFKIRYFSSYHRCRIDNVIYPLVAEYAVTVTDMDTLTMELSTETLHKYAAFDGVSWKICLGIHSIQSSILRFQLLTEKRENFDPMTLYRSAVSFQDPMTGLLSETGFLEQANREAQRSKRYHNPFSFAAFKLHISEHSENKDAEAAGNSHTESNTDNRNRKQDNISAQQWRRRIFGRQEDTKRAEMPEETIYRILCLFSSVLSNHLRSTDLSARLNNNIIMCLFIETKTHGANKAAQKFVRLFEEALKRQGKAGCYSLSYGIEPYAEYKNVEDCIYAACSKANIVNNNIQFE